MHLLPDDLPDPSFFDALVADQVTEDETEAGFESDRLGGSVEA